MYVKQCDCLKHYLLMARWPGHSYVLFICFAISSSQKCLRVSKTESFGLSRICFEMTRQAKMPSLSEKCLRVSKTESYSLSRICFEMTRQVTMSSSKAWLCLADEQHISCYDWQFGRIEKMSKISFFVVTHAQSCWTAVDSTKSVSAAMSDFGLWRQLKVESEIKSPWTLKTILNDIKNILY
jgi:hypothetical protein